MSQVFCRSAFLALCILPLGVVGAKSLPTNMSPGKSSMTTGVPFNQGEGSLEVHKFSGQPLGPNLVFVEGGMTTLGGVVRRSLIGGDVPTRQVTVSSFYMDATPVTNIQYLEYLHSLEDAGEEEAYKAALPNEKVWEGQLAYNDPYVSYYLRHPGFRFYPVVGVSWVQANDYCAWRTKVVNAMLSKKFKKTKPRKKVQDEEGAEQEEDEPSIESGAVLPSFSLPTEAQWEYAARGTLSKGRAQIQTSQRIYPWEGTSVRATSGPYKGKFLANFKRSPGNYKGVAGEDGQSVGTTAYVYAYPPNDLGIYFGSGVREWTLDVYRDLSARNVDDFNPVRRDGVLDPETDYDKATVTDKSRVVKGCAWKDGPYWLSVATRRYLHQSESDNATGFRCVMISNNGNSQDRSYEQIFCNR